MKLFLSEDARSGNRLQPGFSSLSGGVGDGGFMICRHCRHRRGGRRWPADARRLSLHASSGQQAMPIEGRLPASLALPSHRQRIDSRQDVVDERGSKRIPAKETF